MGSRIFCTFMFYVYFMCMFVVKYDNVCLILMCSIIITNQIARKSHCQKTFRIVMQQQTSTEYKIYLRNK
jgi:hypothetical protein